MTDADFQPVFWGRSLMEAELLQGLLEGEGIPCRIPDSLSTDQVTSAQQIMGGRSFEVRVMPKDLARARQVIQEAIQAGHRLEGFPADRPDGAASGKDQDGSDTGEGEKQGPTAESHLPKGDDPS